MGLSSAKAQMSLNLDQGSVNTMFCLYAKQNKPEQALNYLENQKFVNRADINHRDVSGWAALHYSVLNKDTKFLLRLIRLKADINVRGNRGITPLLLASGR